MKVEEEASLVIGIWFECLLPDYAFVIDQTVNISEKEQDRPVVIYPNSFKNTITIRNPVDGASEIKVSDFLGRTIYVSSLVSQDENRIDLGFLNKGVYVITISNQDKEQSLRVIKK